MLFSFQEEVVLFDSMRVIFKRLLRGWMKHNHWTRQIDLSIANVRNISCVLIKSVEPWKWPGNLLE